MKPRRAGRVVAVAGRGEMCLSDAYIAPEDLDGVRGSEGVLARPRMIASTSRAVNRPQRRRLIALLDMIAS